jgi:multiple sugar transport system substrate-binding protein
VRPKSPQYDQVSLAVAAVVHDALTLRETPDRTTDRLVTELNAIVAEH